MKKEPSLKEEMVKTITAGSIAHYKELVTGLVRQDKFVEQIMNEVLAKVRDDFPKAVHDATVSWFCGHMNQMAAAVSQALWQSENQQGMIQEIQKRLGTG